MSETSKRHIRELVGPALVRSLKVGPPERHALYTTELRAALEEFENLIRCENIVHRLLKAKVRGDSHADLSELVEAILIESESVIGLPSEDEAYECQD